jgi:hypothetical protein
MGYTLTDSKLRSLKAAVTKAQNRRDWPGVIIACDRAESAFRKHGHPDCWADFVRHREDAEVQMKLLSFTGPIFS